ncbi:hypothetical protein NEF87_003877 [Candidatus Lokiarchaeum ossiferum]|uniref:AAA+ ATPase domain-containing protein n=1 Tax=Candidatus Lokiarchaeum ossiferum TaxID=2951803 RepID=A0ABY6HXK8_9ARCH|nr:hypothetical protein NEF87_003877 [Candidatus Lokiarchaeum sp. B-35]
MKYYNFPFTAICGQEQMKKALILNIIDPKIGGVLLTGQQGTGKSTAVRSMIDILPEIEVHKGCQFQCNLTDDPSDNWCDFCRDQNPQKLRKPINLVNLPLGATEEMVIGSLDIEKIIREGKRAIQPGLLAKANRGILYVDEINLLPDHLVDILLDVSASRINIIEREGVSLEHPSAFILVGSMNPEEGELRPQISDRLGLEVQIKAPTDPQLRAEISIRVLEFEDQPEKFIQKYSIPQEKLKQQIQSAKKKIAEVIIPEELYAQVAILILKLGLYSQRADITFIRCARAHAAFKQRTEISKEDLWEASNLVFNHRVKRFDESISPEILETYFNEIFNDYK